MDGQLSFFDDVLTAESVEPVLAPMQDFPIHEKLAMEKEIAGMYLSGHPMAEYAAVCKALRTDKIIKILESDGVHGMYRDAAKVRIIAIVSSVKLKTTKNNAMMAFVTVEDMTGAIEMLVFPQTLAEYGTFFLEGNVLDILASVSLREDEEPKLLCNQAKLATKELPQTAEESGQTPAANISVEQPQRTVPALYLRVKNLHCREYERAKQVLDIFDGRNPVIFVLTEEKRQVRAPANMWVDLNDVMVRELKARLGEHNVGVK